MLILFILIEVFPLSRIVVWNAAMPWTHLVQGIRIVDPTPLALRWVVFPLMSVTSVPLTGT